MNLPRSVKLYILKNQRNYILNLRIPAVCHALIFSIRTVHLTAVG